MKLTAGITVNTEKQSLLNCGNEIPDESQGTSWSTRVCFNTMRMSAGSPWCWGTYSASRQVSQDIFCWFLLCIAQNFFIMAILRLQKA